MGCMALGLVGWFASDAGGHGDTRDAIRVGADALAARPRRHLHLATGAVSATVTAIPLGLTLLCAYVAHRLGRLGGPHVGRRGRRDRRCSAPS